MQVCQRCLYTSDHPLNITFDGSGICSGCIVHKEKNILDWQERGQKLRRLLESYRSKSQNSYDCIIPVSGSRDSYFIVHTVKNIYGMNPLLVTYNKQYNTAVGVRNLANLRIKFDVDIMSLTVNPSVVKKITRSTLRRFGSMYWHCLAGQTVYPVQTAARMKIPLIVWGAHQGLDQVGMYSHLDEVEMTRKYRKEHDLMGFEAEDLINDFDHVTESDVEPFVYPDNREIEQVGVRGIYLNNYIRWDSRTQHESMIRYYDYETASQNRTFDFYNDVDCWNYSDVHDFIKRVKHGYGTATDHACRDIRLKHMSRDQALSLVRYHEARSPTNLHLFLNWLGMTENGFNFVIDQHRNPKVWKRNEDWEWQLTEDWLEFRGTTETASMNSSFHPFTITPEKSSADSADDYILIGKGFDL